MGQKVRPTGFRTGIMMDWSSKWYASKADFSDLLVEDAKIRRFIKKKHASGGVSKIRIERTREKVVVFIYSSRVGSIIGKKGEKIDKLTRELEALTHRVIEVKKRVSFRRTMKQAIQKAMENGAKGIRLQLSGRLGGAEMARCEKTMEGSIPLSTLRAKVEYGFAEAATAQGNIGIKVWVNNGDYLTPEENDNAANAQASKVSKKPTRQGKR